MKMTRGLGIGALLIALFTLVGYAATASAGPELWASIKTTAACSLNGSDLTVTVGWIRVKEDTPDPVISRETISLEQRVGNQWVASGVLFDGAFVGNPHDHTFPGVVLEGATSVRAIVVLTVENANTKRPGGKEHLARCDAKVP